VGLAVILSLSACSSGPSQQEKKEAEVDIYDQLKNDNVQYATEEGPATVGSPEFVLKNLADVRAAYFRKQYDSAQKLCKRIISVSPDAVEAYYWLARIAVDENDYNQAYNMASKALTLAKEPNMKAELKRIQVMTQMGAQTQQ